MQTQLIWRGPRGQAVSLQLPSLVVPCGCQFRQLSQMPVLAGLGCSVRDVVGSVRSLRLEHGQLRGILFWCDDVPADIVRGKYEAGFLALRLEISEHEFCMVPRGDELAGFHGPARVIITWQPTAVRLTAGGTR